MYVVLCVITCGGIVFCWNDSLLCAFCVLVGECGLWFTSLKVFSNRSFSAARRLLGASGGHCKHTENTSFTTTWENTLMISSWNPVILPEMGAERNSPESCASYCWLSLTGLIVEQTAEICLKYQSLIFLDFVLCFALCIYCPGALEQCSELLTA